MIRGKTLLLSEVFPPRTGGSGRWFWEVYRRFPRREVVVAAGEGDRAREFDRSHDLDVRRLPLTLPEWGVKSAAGLGGYWRAFRQVRRIVRDERITEIHCGRNLPEGWIAWLLRRTSGVPYACYVHGEELNTAAASRELAWMTRRVFAGARLVIANSRNTAGLLRDQWNISEDRLRVLHPGVDTERFVPAERGRRVRDKLGWDERPVVLTVGRLQKRKGHDMMLRALPAVRERAPNVLYAIVGDGEERPGLEKLVAELGLERHVQFRGEPDDEELIRCYQQCDLFALPNREVDGDFEGFGMVLVEAQACGKPVLAGASGGTAETMRIPETGLTVNCDRPDRLAAAVTELLADPARCERMGRLGREWVVAQFDWESLARQAYAILGGGELPTGQCREHAEHGSPRRVAKTVER